MKALLLLVMQSGWSSAQVPRHRHTSSHSIVSFEEMHLETINADKGKQIDKALSHNHRKVHEGNNAEALTGKHSKPQYEPTKNKKELIERYLDAEPASNRQSFVSKGGTIHELGHPETLGVQVGGVQEPVDKKKSKFSDKDREDDIHNDEDEPPPPTNNDRVPSSPSLSPTADESRPHGKCSSVEFISANNPHSAGQHYWGRHRSYCNLGTCSFSLRKSIF